ncbi:MAG: NnrS family protein, partial [Panacagrimonas sp.]
STSPALLRVLFIALLWLPVTFALYAGQSVWYVLADDFALGRAPAHALFVGFFGSVLVAMVSRVTQGHSGGPLVLPRIGAYAFLCVQIVAVIRVAAEIVPDTALWQALAALGWLVALGPWALWLAGVYLRPRVDGKPG